MSLKSDLIEKKLSIGSWVTLGSSSVAELMARLGFFDWLVIDMEHSAIELKDTFEMIQAIELSNVPPLVRLTSNNSDLVKRVMDAGAHGVVVPSINSKEEAEKAVQSVYYPPKGSRGAGLARAQGYGANFDSYNQWLQENGVVIVMIEHIDAVNNVEQILSVQDVDGFIIGPYDLSASLGVPGDFENQEVVSAISRISEVGRAVGIAGGIHIVHPDLEILQHYIGLGFTFIGYGMDIRFLDTSCRSHGKQIKKIK